MEFCGYISDRRSPFYVTLLLPLITIKIGIERVRGFLHKLIWSELAHQIKPKEPDPVAEIFTILMFGVFCLLCVITYKFYLYYTAISIFIGGCWYFDMVLSKRNYAHKLAVHLTLTKDDYCLWELKSAQSRKFHQSRLVGIGISRVKIGSSAFATAIAQPWQVFLILEQRGMEDGINLVMGEASQILKALEQARELSQFFQVPITFLNAQNVHIISKPQNPHKNLYQYLEMGNKSQVIPKLPKGIGIRKSQHKWHIFSQWTKASSGYFFDKVFEDSGFLLFVLFLTEFMSRLGQMIDSMILTQRQLGIIYLDFGIFFSSYSFSWLRILEVAIAIGIMVWKGIQISQVKHIYLDANYLKYGINRKAIAQLDTKAIEFMVSIKQPEPQVLICSENIAIEIKNLLVPEDYEALFLGITAGLDQISISPEHLILKSKTLNL